MSKETTVSRTGPAMPAATTHAGPDQKAGLAQQAARRAEAHRGRIAQRAYELYDQGGRHEGRDVEDWLNAERQLAGAPGQS